MNLKGQTALITGCNRGLGYAFLKEFAAQGVNIIACMRKKVEDVEADLQKIAAENGVSIYPFYFELTDEDSIKAAFKEIFKLKVPIDILINNAGVAAKGLFQMTSIKSIKDVFQVNFFAHVIITQYVLKLMARTKKGCIINMGSIGGLDAYPAYVSYGCSKAAMMYLTKTLSQEYAPYNIRVNTIAPGMADTDMVPIVGDEAKEEILRRCAMKRIAKPEEIVKLAVFLASDSASFITGQTIRVDGGM